ncbi:hypothetical protein KP509_18G083000 [Ceratopteris richardii]|uniref:Glycosyl transferase family 1 domain-containing protein n=1 Tax=Ceratopteris richardii TaxID=49495 RepID=A0A8T2SRC7_CERRI|nr:hypothetical protein KP509_18G083000 [Ceratopteris richardii]
MENDEKSNISSYFLGRIVRPLSVHVSDNTKSSLSGRFVTLNSPSFRKSPSLRSPPPNDFRSSASVLSLSCRRLRFSSRLLFWLVVIGFWAYFGLLLQSWRAETENNRILQLQIRDDSNRLILEGGKRVQREKLFPSNIFDAYQHERRGINNGQRQGDEWEFPLVREELPDRNFVTSDHAVLSKAKISSWQFPLVGTVNTSIGRSVGPFQHLEDSISLPRGKLKSCSAISGFAKYVHGRSFMLIFHELSMTGSPLAMLELGEELLNCGGNVLVVALSQKGGLLQKLLATKMKVLKSKSKSALVAATRVDVIIAGSAVCASWIEKFVLVYKKPPKKLMWWVMENRKEYFDRCKHMLRFAKCLVFLSQAQLEQWLSWAQSNGILLPKKVKVIPLSVNAEISALAALYAKHLSQKIYLQQLRDKVRAEMGLVPEDVLITTLASINPGKGQLKLLQALGMLVEESGNDSSPPDKGIIPSRTGNSRLKLLIGSVGSKSNKVFYIQKMLTYVADHPALARSLFWTSVTIHVASLYAASDIYVMNSQGLGETFGRVTIEAMAFGLPIVGTSAGGTSEVVEDNTSGLLHPVGAGGIDVLAEHIRILGRNATLRRQMGLKGMEKVKQSYMKERMYEDIADLLSSL